jgi:hypothetical protein
VPAEPEWSLIRHFYLVAGDSPSLRCNFDTKGSDVGELDRNAHYVLHCSHKQRS